MRSRKGIFSTCRQVAVGGLVLVLAACSGGGSNAPSTPGSAPQPAPSRGLSAFEIDAREQRQTALRPVSAHNAYERGLTGRGVRIGIEDETLDFLHREFAGRIDTRNAGITITHPVVAGTPCPRVRCIYVDADSPEDVDRIAINWVRENGWPQYDDYVYIRVLSANPLGRYHEIPALAERGNDGRVLRNHGTAVASVAAGDRLGVAPDATIVPRGIPLDNDPATQRAQNDAVNAILVAIDRGFATPQETREIDELIADGFREGAGHVDIVNESYGIGADNDIQLFRQYRGEGRIFTWIRNNLPRFWRAYTQQDIAERDKTLYVTAAGNDGLRFPAPGAAAAGFVPELRGLHFAAAGLESGGGGAVIAENSNRCGPLPSNWNPARHGRHYCLAAPGWNVNAAEPGSNTPIRVNGTSFAAPMISGGLALMMEAFRGQLHPREIGLRMVNTANNRGIYADSTIYGAGVMDLDAATRPIGILTTGTGSRRASVDATFASVPSSWGDVGGRLRGAEFAAFDEWNAPFWSPLAGRFRSVAPSYVPPRPGAVDANEERHLMPALSWMEGRTGETWKLRFAADVSKGDHAVRTAGISANFPGTTLRFGLVHEPDTNQGASQGGAFGLGAGSSMVFMSRRYAHDAGPLRFEGTWTVAAGDTDHAKGAMLQTTPALYTAAEAGLAYGVEEAVTRLSLSQPLRAETGAGTVTYPVGRNRDGEWLYTSRNFALSPDAREVRLSLRHDRDVGVGRIAVEVAHAVNAGHVRGRERTSIGLGYRLTW